MTVSQKIRRAIEQVKKTGISVRVNNSILIKKLNGEIYVTDENIKHDAERIDSLTSPREGSKNGRVG